VALLALALITLAVGATYWGGIDAAFVYDDGPNIRDNPHIQSLSPLHEALSIPLWGSGLTVDGRPVLSASFALNRHFAGPGPIGYRLVNIAIHIVAAWLLFAIVRHTLNALGGRTRRRASFMALAVALIWAVHPLHTESVTYLVQRCESLAGMLVLLSLYAAIRSFVGRHTWAWYAGAVVGALLAAGTKETAAVIPVLVLLYDAAFCSGSFRRALARHGWLYGLLLSSWVAVAALVILTPESRIADLQSVGPLTYLLTQPGVILHYLRLAFWPHPLVIDYSWPAAVTLAAVAVPLLLLALVLGGALFGWRRRKGMAFLVVAFFIMLAPSSGLFPTRQFVQEHRMYLALIPVVCLAVMTVEAGLGKLNRHTQPRVMLWTQVALVLAALLPLAVRTAARNTDYQTEIVLWSRTLRDRPQSYRAHNNLGGLLDAAGNPGRAIFHFREAVALNPEYATAHYNWGNALVALGNLVAAEVHYRRALAIRPAYDMAHTNLGNLLAKRGEEEEAITHFRAALKLNPKRAETHFNLANVLVKQRKHAEALTHYQRTVTIDPGYASAHRNYGITLVATGRLDEAISHLRRATDLQPDDPAAHLSLGATLLQQGDLRGAETSLRRALFLDPSLFLAQNLLLKVHSGTEEPARNPD